MTHKERLLTALNHEEPDRVPICAWYTPEAEKKLLRHLGVNVEAGEAAYRAAEDLHAYPNGVIIRRQTCESLILGQRCGHARDLIEVIAMPPVKKIWYDVIEKDPRTCESHTLPVLEVSSKKCHDIYWKRRANTCLDAIFRRIGRLWLDKGIHGIDHPDSARDLPPVFSRKSAPQGL